MSSIKITLYSLLLLPNLVENRFTTCKQVYPDEHEGMIAFDVSEKPAKKIFITSELVNLLIQASGLPPFSVPHKFIHETPEGKLFFKVHSYNDETGNNRARTEWEGLNAVAGLKNTLQVLDCFEMKNHLIFVFEHLEIDLLVAVFRNILSPQQKFSVAIQLLILFIELQNLGFLHGDFKLSNVMCRKLNCEEIVLIDFEQSSVKKSIVTGGTQEYTAPERINRIYHYHDKVAENWTIAQSILEIMDLESFLSRQAARMIRDELVFADLIYMQQNIDLCISHLGLDMQKSIRRWLSFFPPTRSTLSEILEDIKGYGPEFFATSPRQAQNLKNNN